MGFPPVCSPLRRSTHPDRFPVFFMLRFRPLSPGPPHPGRRPARRHPSRVALERVAQWIRRRSRLTDCPPGRWSPPCHGGRRSWPDRPRTQQHQGFELPVRRFLLPVVALEHREKVAGRVVIRERVARSRVRPGLVDVAVPIYGEVIGKVGPALSLVVGLVVAQASGGQAVLRQHHRRVMDGRVIGSILLVPYPPRPYFRRNVWTSH
jgi:hypothetical protein